MCLLKTVGEAEATYPQSCPKPLINELYNLGGLGIDNQLVFVFRIFYVAVGGKGADVLAVAPLIVKHLADFL